jgi:amino acid transporter
MARSVGYFLFIEAPSPHSLSPQPLVNVNPKAQLTYPGMMSLVMIVQFTMGLSIAVAASRQAWAFSRDGALPFSSFFRVVSKRFGYIPLRALWGCIFLAAILGLLCLIAPAAAGALFSLGVAGNNLAWGLPIFARLVWGEHKFVPGPFHTKKLSKPIGWLAVVFLLFGTILVMFPTGGPDPTPESMNYTVVISSAVWGGAMIYYFGWARKWFVGPKITLDLTAMDEDHKQALADEGLMVDGLKDHGVVEHHHHDLGHHHETDENHEEKSGDEVVA